VRLFFIDIFITIQYSIEQGLTMLVGVLEDEEHILVLFSSAELQASHTLVPNIGRHSAVLKVHRFAC
jgi:hypothetical protein